MALCLVMLLQVHELMAQRKRAVQSKVRRGATSQWHSLTRHVLVVATAGVQVAAFTRTPAQVYAYCRWYAEQNSGSHPELLRAVDAMAMEKFSMNGTAAAEFSRQDAAHLWVCVFPHNTAAWRTLVAAFCAAAGTYSSLLVLPFNN